MTSPGMGDRTGRSWWPWVERVHGGGELRFVHGACTIMWLEDLTPQQLSQLRAALEERRVRARGEVARLIAHVQELHVPDVGDGQDVAAGEASRQRAAALLAKQESALAEIEAVLQDEEPSVRIQAAIALGNLGRRDQALAVLLNEARLATSDAHALWALDGIKYLDAPEVVQGVAKKDMIKGNYSSRSFDHLAAGGSMQRPVSNPVEQ